VEISNILYDSPQDPEKRDGTRHDALLCGHRLLLLQHPSSCGQPAGGKRKMSSVWSSSSSAATS
jgi:hypothetical protein